MDRCFTPKRVSWFPDLNTLQSLNSSRIEVFHTKNRNILVKVTNRKGVLVALGTESVMSSLFTVHIMLYINKYFHMKEGESEQEREVRE